MNSRRIIVSRSRNPFEVFLLVACVLSGIGGFVNPGRSSQVIVEHFSEPWLSIWYAGLIQGGAISLIGAVGPRLIYLYIERIGLFILATTLLIFSSILVFQVNRLVALPVLTLLFFSAACIYRLVQIHKELKGVING